MDIMYNENCRGWGKSLNVVNAGALGTDQGYCSRDTSETSDVLHLAQPFTITRCWSFGYCTGQSDATLVRFC